MSSYAAIQTSTSVNLRWALLPRASRRPRHNIVMLQKRLNTVIPTKITTVLVYCPLSCNLAFCPINSVCRFLNVLSSLLNRSAKVSKKRESGRFFQTGQMCTPFLEGSRSHEELYPQAVIQNIHWPQPKCDGDEEDPVPLDKVSLVTRFLRKFIEEASPEVLRDLMNFWVGWELLTRNLIVEVVTSTYLVALTCFFKLKLPRHYQTYKMQISLSYNLVQCFEW
ncbi:uncharacterized protein LOC116400070 [Anarrhichthys ocellatus]|uniref:uncharacterized protein LOC116400070 n=1 Tax=Anarrhichthys ocellatus TaxID=433405 RepID=UPI0012EE6BCD|nr:uncharacterized protein LOC116400070 [Anarrhichthys ocellatus]